MGTPRMSGSYDYPDGEVAAEVRCTHRVAVMRGREEVDAYAPVGTVAEALDKAEDHLRFWARNSPAQWSGRFVLVAGGARREVEV